MAAKGILGQSKISHDCRIEVERCDESPVPSNKRGRCLDAGSSEFRARQALKLSPASGAQVSEMPKEIYALRGRLQRYPQAISASLQAARTLNRPVDTLEPREIRRLV